MENKSRSEEADTTAQFFVFNFEDNQGFAIMSSDKRTASLYALADSGSLELGDSIENPGLEIFLNNIARAPLKPNDDKVDSIWAYTEEPFTAYGNWSKPMVANNHHCPVKWHQEEPYNAKCPMEYRQRCPTGCVPLAVAQLMAFYKYPDSYYCGYGGADFHWDEMTAAASIDDCSEQAKSDVADLMSLLGMFNNLNVVYHNTGSGAHTSDVCMTLKNFGFSNGGTYSNYNEVTAVDDLLDGYPIIMRGHDTITGFGHAWLAHGIMWRDRTVKTIQYGKVIKSYTETQYYLLCNWGEGGDADGYYVSYSFKPYKGAVYGDDSTTGNATTPTSGSWNHNFIDIYAVTGIRK